MVERPACRALRANPNGTRSAGGGLLRFPGPARKHALLAAEEVRILSQYVHEISGIDLASDKAYFMESRLGGLLRQEGCGSYGELVRKARSEAGRGLERAMIDAITVQETLFFRDGSPFELLRHKILPDLIDRRSARAAGTLPVSIRIWVSACATGQEVYSICMVLKELLPDRMRHKIRLLGTDISDAAIGRASYGAYNKFEIQRGLDRHRIDKYFTPDGEQWRIRDEIRAMASFRRLNLLGPLDGLGTFDIVFCRNVAIYFRMESRKQLFHRIADVMEPDGVLIIGASESLLGICPKFEPRRYLRSVFYQRSA